MWLERGSDMVYKDAQLTRYSLRHNQQRQRFCDMVHEHNGIICALCTKKYSAASGMLYKVAAHHRHDSHSRDIVPLAPIRRDFSTTSSSLNTPFSSGSYRRRRHHRTPTARTESQNDMFPVCSHSAHIMNPLWCLRLYCTYVSI